MKKIKLLLLSVFSIAVFDSCEKITSENNTTSASFEDVDDLIQGRLPSLYASLRSPGLYHQGGFIGVWGDAGIDTHSATFFPPQWSNFFAYQYGPGEQVISEVWAQFYSAIKQINAFIGQMDSIEGDAGEKLVPLAEARFLRGMLYFDMVKIWGDIPLVISSDLTLDGVRADADLTNSTAEEVYLQIIEDLQFAKANLLSKSSSDIASKEAAGTLLGKVYLQMTTPEGFGGIEGGIDANGNAVSVNTRFIMAGLELKEVIDSGVFQLEENYADVFDSENEDSNSEVIFAVAFDGPNNNTGGSFGDILGPIGDGKDGGAFGTYRVNLDFAFDYLEPNGLVDNTTTISAENLLPAPNQTFFQGNNNFRPSVLLLGADNFISDTRFAHNIARFNANTLAAIFRGERASSPGALYTASNLVTGAWSPYKFIKPLPNPNDAGDGSIDFPYLRYADVLLMYAEVLNELGDNANATMYLNQVVDRPLKDQILTAIPALPPGVGYTAPVGDTPGTPQAILDDAVEDNLVNTDKTLFLVSQGLSKEDLLDRILKERNLELCYEGKRKEDLLRTGKLEEVVNSYHIGSAANRGLADQVVVREAFRLNRHNSWPIPLNELIINTNLKQNCEYGQSGAGCF